MRKMRASEIAAVAGGTSPVILPEGGGPSAGGGPINGPSLVTSGPGNTQIAWFNIGNTGTQWGAQLDANGGILTGGNLYYNNGGFITVEGTFNSSGALTGGSLTFKSGNGDSLTFTGTGNNAFGLNFSVPIGNTSGQGSGAFSFSLTGSSSGAGSYGGSSGGYIFGISEPSYAGSGSGSSGTPWITNQWWDNYGQHQS